MTATVEITALDALHAEILERMTMNYYLVDVGRGDTLPEDVVEALVNGEEPWETTGGEALTEWESEARHTSAAYEIEAIVDDVLRDWSKRGATDEVLDDLRDDYKFSDHYDDVREEMYDRDRSQWFQQLIESHGPVMMRVPVEGMGEGEWTPSFVTEDMADNHYNEVGDLTDESYAEVRRLLGVKNDAGVINDVVRDTPSEVYMAYWLFSADLDDIIDAQMFERVNVKGATLLMGNPFTGAYAESEETFTAVVKPGDIKTDKGAFGYSWTDVAGTSPSYYVADLTEATKPQPAVSLIKTVKA